LDEAGELGEGIIGQESQRWLWRGEGRGRGWSLLRRTWLLPGRQNLEAGRC